MRELTVVPAIDLRGGRCVRLLYGDPARESRYDGDPVDRARAFAAAGARRLHVVDLDGAFGSGDNLASLRAICAAVDVPVQTGGGVRSAEDVRVRLRSGAATVVLGTLLAEAPALGRAIVAEFGHRIVAGVDVRGETLAVRGWTEAATSPLDAFVRELAAWGVARIVFTEIGRDGAGTGFDAAALTRVAALAPLAVTASGGAKTLADLQRLAEGTPPSVDSAIVGRALYEGTLDLAAAIALCSGGDEPA